MALYIIPGGVFLSSGTYWIYEKEIRALIRMVLNITLYLDNHLFVSIFVEKLDIMANRETGFYWILIEDRWQVAYYASAVYGWEICGENGFFPEFNIKEIGDRVYREPKLNEDKFKALITGTSPWKENAENRIEGNRLKEWQKVIDSSGKFDDYEIIQYMKQNFNPPTPIC